MATATATTARRRGAVAAHDDETLLELVAGVARLAAADPRWRLQKPERISMRTFNEAKLVFDRDRGLTDPATDPQRTPTANAIVMRLNEHATRRITWAELVAAALRGDPTMWLAAARRAAAVEPVALHELRFALRYVAGRLRRDTLTRGEYRAERDAAVRDDVERHGDDALLDRLLPTLNRIDGQMRWAQALKSPASTHRRQRGRPRPGVACRAPPARTADCPSFRRSRTTPRSIVRGRRIRR